MIVALVIITIVSEYKAKSEFFLTFRLFSDEDLPPQCGQQRCHLCQYSQERLETQPRDSTHHSGNSYFLYSVPFNHRHTCTMTMYNVQCMYIYYSGIHVHVYCIHVHVHVHSILILYMLL